MSVCVEDGQKATIVVSEREYGVWGQFDGLAADVIRVTPYRGVPSACVGLADGRVRYVPVSLLRPVAPTPPSDDTPLRVGDRVRNAAGLAGTVRCAENDEFGRRWLYVLIDGRAVLDRLHDRDVRREGSCC